MKRVLLVILAAALAPLAASAQQSAAPAAAPEANPVSSALRGIVARESRVVVAGAEEMPEDKYSYHPTPDQMTFGQLVAHMATFNFGMCSTISGVPAPKMDALAGTDPKDKLVGALKGSFDFCTSSLANLDDSKLGEQLPFFGGRTASRATLMFVLAADFADHYSTEASYLRLNRLLPPSAQPRK
jgi:curli biogenesis system outer membrane secretion channel CsgG